MKLELAKDREFEGVTIGLRPKFGDERGWFSELYTEGDLGVTFVKDNVSRSTKGTIRGLHFQNPNPQGKLVTVLQGEVVDYIVDLRQDSKTFGKWKSYNITDLGGQVLYVPEGFAHGFQVTSEEDAIFHYKCTDHYHPENEHTLYFFDEAINIDQYEESINMSKKDLQGKRLSDFSEQELF